MLKYYKLVLSFLLLPLLATTAIAEGTETTPLSLREIVNIPVSGTNVEKDSIKLEIRRDAMEEVALSYGALSGLAYRNWEINKIIQKQELILDAVFNFDRLMIPTHYGTFIEPPIISESENAFLLGDDGMTASMTSKTYSIGENAKIVTTARNWRNYIFNTLDLTPPEDLEAVLMPRDSEELALWKAAIIKGWNNGEEQANDIFESNLALLVADYVGMIRYKKLLAQKMISRPYAVKENRGVTGNSNEMRIDDKAVIITSIPALNKSSESWEPTER